MSVQGYNEKCKFRFAVYEVVKQQVSGDQNLSFLQKIALSGISGVKLANN